MILDSDSGSQGVKGKAPRVPRGQGVGLNGLMGPKGSWDRPTGGQGVLGLLGHRGSRGRPIGSQGVKG